MKKLLAFCLALVCALSLAPVVRADVIWEPENDFYKRHSRDCTYENRYYYANGADGFVTLWDEPDGDEVVKQYENSQRLLVQFIYEDWGCILVWNGRNEISGWVPLSELVLVYDSRSFAEEYSGQIQPYDNQFFGYDGDAKTVYFFEYPGAASASVHFFLTDEQIRENLTGSGEYGSYISSIFVDENGLTWGYVSYMYGHLNAWFCLDYPDMETPGDAGIPVRQVSTPELIPAQTPVMPERTAKDVSNDILPWVLVGVVVIVTAAALVVIKKKRK